AELLVAELRRAGFEPAWNRVETEPEFRAALENRPDIIFSDYSMPQFSGLRAAELTRESGRDIPFILVSGTVGEEIAVEAMRSGATDYLLKDRLARLGSAVERALREARERGQRKQVEHELRESEHRFRRMLENLQLIAMTLDREGRITFANDYLLRLTGRTRSEVLGADWFELFLPETGTGLKELFLEHLALNKISAHRQNPIQTARGELRDILWNNMPLRDAAGNIVGTASIGEDVTERKRAEAALRESEEKFRQIAENIREVFWLTDPVKRQMLYISPAYEAIWGRSCQSLYDSPQTWLEAIHPDDRERIHQAALTKQEGGEYDETYRILRPDGSVRWIHDRAFPVRNESGAIYRVVGVAEDVTNQRKLEEQFHQAQKMEAVGQLAGGVAHDFNNILAVIQMSCELIKTEGKLSAAQSEFAEGISDAARRAAALVRQLLLFSRRQIMQQRDLDLNEIVNGLSQMLRRIIGEDVNLELRLRSGSLPVHADAGMLEQVLMNLAVNARDAMPGGGRLCIETGEKDVDADHARLHPDASPGRHVWFAVSDTGQGIPPEIVPRIFEPFFTTKQPGKGTGLGLATVFGIVKQHRGWISVRSEPGAGTCFQIFFPAGASAPPQKSAPVARRKAGGGPETILVAEDDRVLRGLTRITLEGQGYRVVEAASGAEAVKLWPGHCREIGLLLTDLVMPDGMSGQQLALRFLQDNPMLKVVYMSGYSPEAAGRELELRVGENFVRKPCTPNQLLETVRRCLDG
ncbi:MAG TPA: PAS domain S-box protein, partial [Verrucomicrobiae bacterium]|nr:PAS domain S-box protein [Verrucomicrobiae bacterium]